jgi:polysaccharide biosynthesis/export protein
MGRRWNNGSLPGCRVGWRAIVIAILVLCNTEAPAQYRLESGDVVEVSVYGVQDFKRRTAVTLDGDISLPLLGDIRAAGLTLSELRVKLKDILAKSNIVRSPDVTADLVEYRPIYVNGHVAKPGAHPFQPGLTVRHAVAIAGGYELMRFRMDNPLLLAPDLRSQYETLWTDYVRREARVTSLQAELEGNDMPDLGKLDSVPVARRIISDLVKLELDYFNVRNADQQKEREYLQRARRHAEDQVSSLVQGQEQETSAVQLQSENLARTTTLSKQGLTPLTRLTEDQRAIALQRSRQLENGARLADARRILEDYGRRLERTDDDRRLRLLRELQEAVAEVEKVRTQLQAVGEKLLYVGAIKSQIASGNLGEPEIAIYRKVDGQRSRLVADEDTEIFPGDVIDITFSQKHLLLSGTR